jgi:hypothetical protein
VATAQVGLFAVIWVKNADNWPQGVVSIGVSNCNTELVLGPSVTQADEFDAAAAGALKRGAINVM